MEQSKIEIIGRFVSNSQKSRFKVQSVKINGEDATVHQNPDALELTETKFLKNMVNVYRRLKLYRSARITITIDENE